MKAIMKSIIYVTGGLHRSAWNSIKSSTNDVSRNCITHSVNGLLNTLIIRDSIEDSIYDLLKKMENNYE